MSATNCFRFDVKALLIFLTLLVAAPLHAAISDLQRQQTHTLLKQNDDPRITSLPEGEREILLGLLELDNGDNSAAITILSQAHVRADPVAAMIRAEAYRRESVAAAIRAGNYAHAVGDDIDRLKQAKITAGLDEAERRLEQLVIDLAKVEVEPEEPLPAVDVAEQSSDESWVDAGPATVTETADVEDSATATATETAEEHKAETVTADTAPNLRQQMLTSLRDAVEAWRLDWQSRDGDAYLSHYHPKFSNDKHDFASWSSYKRRVNGSKRYIKISIDNIRITGGPVITPDGEAVIISFYQRYRSSNHNSNSRKQLLMVRENQNAPWLILSEGNSLPAIGRHITTRDAVAINRSAALSVDSDGAGAKLWAINIASFDEIDRAEQMAASIIMDGEQQPFVSEVPIGERSVHRVRIGMYPGRREAVDAMMQICPQLEVADCWLENLHKD